MNINKLPKACRNMVRAYSTYGYHVARSDLVNAIKLVRRNDKNRRIYIVKEGPFKGVSFLRKEDMP